MTGTMACLGLVIAAVYVFIYICILEINKEIKRE